MVKVLNVAEKPSVAKAITQILSRGHSTSRTGFSKYNRCYDFEYDGKQMIVTSVSGHIMNIDFTDTHKQWHSCDPLILFEAPIVKKISSDKENICKTLRRESRKCSELILWLDCDREGENIAFEVIDVCRKANARIITKRARFSSLVARQIFYAMNHLVLPNSNENDAVDARQEIDLRIGAAFTRFQTLRIQKKTHCIESVVSYGPCQFPTLGFVVDRWQRQQSFVPEPFWTIKVFVGDTIFNWQRQKLFDRRACFLIFEMMNECPMAIVESVEKREKLKYRPVPLETVELQKRCSKWLRLPSQRTMQIAETLYQRGLISYPRTETNGFHQMSESDLKNLCRQQTKSNQWGQYAANFRFRLPTKGKKNDNAHPPIHPTKFDETMYGNLSADEKRVFEFVVRHFLACCSENAKGYQTKIILNIANERFTTNGLIIFERNYLKVYKYEKWKSREIRFNFCVNQSLFADDMKMSEGKTSCPELLTEEELIALMDQNGIGTDATMAQHIETIQTRQYAFKRPNDRRFVPKELGIALCKAYQRMNQNLDKPELRASMEANLKQIAEGRMDKNEFLTNCLQQMKQIFILVQQNAQTLDQAMTEFFGNFSLSTSSNVQIIKRNLSKCGKCSNMQSLKKNGQNVRFLHCSHCNNDLRVPRGALSSIAHNCPLCNYQVLSVKNVESNKEHKVCPSCFHEKNLRCFQCTFSDCALSTKTQSDLQSIKECNVCNKGSMHLKYIEKLKKFTVGCNLWKDGCKNTIWFPSMITNGTKVSNERCLKCNALKIVFVVDRKNSPSHIPNHFVGCCFGNCDAMFAELKDFEANLRGFGFGHSNNSNSSSRRFIQMQINSHPSNGDGYLVQNQRKPKKRGKKRKRGRGRGRK